MKNLLAAALLILPCLLVDDAFAADTVLAVLEPPAIGSFHHPRQPLYISLPNGLPAELAPYISLELDAIDVTRLTDRADDRFVHTPVQPLSHGEHALRLMYYGDDGSVRELGYWQFEVRQSPRFRQATIEAQFDATVSQRMAEDAQVQGSAISVQGAGQIAGELEGNSWHMNGATDLIFEKDRSQSLTGRNLDAANFLLTAKKGRYQFNAGDHSVGQSSLVLDGYQRRGLSSQVEVKSLNSTASLFTISGNQRVGLAGGLGIGDGDNRVTGGTWVAHPFAKDNADIRILSTYLTGSVSQPDYGSLTPDLDVLTHEGEAWNWIVDSQFFQRQLRLRLEGANSRYDFDGQDGFDPSEDDAWSALALYEPAATDHEIPIEWSLGVEAKHVGTYYRSLANNSLPSDIAMRSLFSNVARDKWYWDGNYAIEDNNVNEDVNYAITKTKQWSMNLGYNDYDQPEAGSLLAILGQPNYSASLYRTVMEDSFTPMGEAVTDLTTQGMNISTTFSHPSWNWALGLGEDTLEDHTQWQPNTRMRSVQLSSAFNFGEFYSLGLGWQAQQTLYREENATTDRQLYSLDATAQFIPDRFSGQLSIGMNQSDARDDPFYAQRDQSTYISGSLNWRIKEADTNRAGLEMSLTFARNDFRDRLNPINHVNGYQAFLEFRTTLPAAYPGGLQ